MTARLRPKPLRAAVRPFRELRFTYSHYDSLLGQLVDTSRFAVLPLRELDMAPPDRVAVGIRHDVDDRLDSALELAAREYRRGLRATYFVLHTATYYRHDQTFIRKLRTLQDEYGHEIGWHNDLVTLQVVQGIDSVRYLHSELAWLRQQGIRVTGTAAHGARACQELGFTNLYFFSDFPDVDGDFPNRDLVAVGGRDVQVLHARLADFGLEYEATQLRRDAYFSDASFDARGRRSHPLDLSLEALAPGSRAILLVHPCLWDTSAAAHILREAGRLSRRALSLLSRGA